MVVYSLYIINKAGGLIYQNDLTPGLSKLTANDYLVLAGTVHGVFAIASRITPSQARQRAPANGTNASIVSSISKVAALNTVGTSSPVNPNTSGLKSIETDQFSIFIYQTVTGLKFMLITSPNGVAPATGSAAASTAPNSTASLAKNGDISTTDLNKNIEIAEGVLRKVYTIYSDFVMKNPFYSLDMPIRVELFDIKVKELFGV